MHPAFDSSPKPRLLAPARAIVAVTAALWFGALYAQTPPVGGRRALPELQLGDLLQAPPQGMGSPQGEAVRQAHSQSVRLAGYMVKQATPTPGRFMLTPSPVQLGQAAQGDAMDLPASTVVVHLAASQQHWVVAHVRGLLEVSGLLSVGQAEDHVGQLTWVHLQLAPDTTGGMSPGELATYLQKPPRRQQALPFG